MRTRTGSACGDTQWEEIFTLRDIEVDPKDIKVAVIWGGVVGSYDDLMNHWQSRKYDISRRPRELAQRNNDSKVAIRIPMARRKPILRFGKPLTPPITSQTSPLQFNCILVEATKRFR